MPLLYHFRYAASPELKIKMNVYNKLKIAILAIIASQNIHAMTLDPIQIQSAPGELLYAEINFRNADPDASIRADLASAEDLIAMGAGHQPPGHLNFFTRKDSSGSGVITITSSRPLTDAELNIIVKISEGNSSRLQHIKTPLKRSMPISQQMNAARNERTLAPVIISNERDIALNLPVSAQYAALKPNAAGKPKETLLSLNSSLPPSMDKNSASAPFSAPSISAAPAPQPAVSAEAAPAALASNNANAPAAPQGAAVQKQVSSDPLAQKYAAEQQAAQLKAPAAAVKSPQDAARAPSVKPAPQSAAQKYVVQSNESLWGIASRIASTENRPVGDVMKQIKANNAHAFIQGDSNRLKRGAALNLNGAALSKERQKISAAALKQMPSTQSGKTKYRLNEAEMSLVAEKTQDSAHASANKSTEKNQTSNELSLKVMTSREKTVKLQRNVTQLELALNQKDHRIQLLNTRLAQLEQQLKARQAEKKPIN
ncbi:hypothetical protein F941_00409 [Acinetobacter bouvetii DSM 14964 = CIP 107468]|uniref:FimV N-terminal domain-containing protein n=2 Tax=Acinetobacter bouvetii TaxID=202951 RepID=N9DTN9_9GAMM|nr:hypothetical protein F941_00409 [Acinetobacter bouvetii DSM 14964 = CIP 107468]